MKRTILGLVEAGVTRVVMPSAPAGTVRPDVVRDFDERITPHILRNWPRERIVQFAKHLLGDVCQACPEHNARPDAPARKECHAQAR